MGRNVKLRFVTFLTVVRFPLVLLFFAGALVHSRHESSWLFAATFAALITSAVTDLFDGYFARKFDVVTKFGAHADPLMDKFFYLATLPLLVFVALENGHRPHALWLLVMSLMFLSRDQWVTFLRSIGSMYNVSGGANFWGKLRTAINFPVICCIYHVEEAPVQILNKQLLYAAEIVAVIVNLISLYVYTRRYWPYLQRSAQPEGSSNSDASKD